MCCVRFVCDTVAWLALPAANVLIHSISPPPPIVACCLGEAGRLCNNSLLLPSPDLTLDTWPYIECTAQNDTVGRKNLTIATGFYQVCA